MIKLYIKINNNSTEFKHLHNYYSRIKLNMEDSGVDLMLPYSIVLDQNSYNTQLKIDHQISYMMTKNNTPIPSFLFPRSSISKTNLRLANSVGIIDKGYRGSIIAKVDVLHIHDSNVSNDLTKKGKKIFQICSPNLEPIQEIHILDIVDSLPSSIRNTGAFGSTG
jgi:dUTP pyrophosphatase